jgi:hypothetical protein
MASQEAEFNRPGFDNRCSVLFYLDLSTGKKLEKVKCRVSATRIDVLNLV